MIYIYMYIYIHMLCTDEDNYRDLLGAPYLGAPSSSSTLRKCILSGLLLPELLICLHFSSGARHPCAGAMLIFSVSLQLLRMTPA